MTKSIKRTIEVTEKRRIVQEEYNKAHGITPHTVKREIGLLVEPEEERVHYPEGVKDATLLAAEQPHNYLTIGEVRQKIKEYEIEMKRAAKEMRFEDAAHFRDLMKQYQQIELSLA